MREITLASNSRKFFKYFTCKIKIINFYCSEFCKLLKTISSWKYVVDIKKILVPILLIYIYLHCVRSSSWCATMLATLRYIICNDNSSALKNNFRSVGLFNLIKRWLMEGHKPIKNKDRERKPSKTSLVRDCW